VSTNVRTNALRAQNITVAERRDYAVKMRTAGLNFREILAEMISRYGRENLPPTYDERYVYRDVKYELNKLRAETLETAQDLRLMELDRLDQLQTAIMNRALGGDLKAIDRILNIMKMRSNLMGLNAPTQTKVEVSDWRSEIVNLIKTGKITVEQAEEELGKELVAGLLVAGGEGVIEGEFTPEQIQG